MCAIEYSDDMTSAERYQEIACILAKGFLSKRDQETMLEQIGTSSPRQMDQAQPKKITERIEDNGNTVTELDLSNCS